MKTGNAVITLPPAIVDRWANNRAAYDAAVQHLKIFPVWTIHELWREPMFLNWVEGLQDKYTKIGRQKVHVTFGGPNTVNVEWEEPA